MNLSNFNKHSNFKAILFLIESGWNRDQIIHKINVDTHNHLIEMGYEPTQWLKEYVSNKLS